MGKPFTKEVIFSPLEKISWEYVMFSQQVLSEGDVCIIAGGTKRSVRPQLPESLGKGKEK